ncbi:MAG: peptidoglycan-binding domain-containing protein [Mycobacteriales bacterium]
MIAMLDSADSRSLLPGYAYYAGYVDGGIGDQPNAARVAAAHPGAHVLAIALDASHDADCLDVEAGAASPGDVPGWVTRQHLRGITRPCVYASVSAMKDAVLPLVSGWLPGSARLWTAHYGLGAHICGPRTCGELPVDADGTQWTSAYPGAGGALADMSALADNFFGATAPPTANWTETIMQQLPEVKQGATGTHVRTVQFQCGERGHATAVDGAFGPATTAAVRAVQLAAKLGADGIVGPRTWPALLGL